MDEHIATITQCMDQVLAGKDISREQAETLFAAGKEEPFFLMAAADKIRKTFCGGKMRFCSDVNARSGRCTENCKFCAQSGWYHTGVKEYPLRSPEDLLREAKQAEVYGAERFGIVTSGRGQSDPAQFASIVEAVKRHFPSICTTHTYEEKEAHIRRIQQTGLEVSPAASSDWGKRMKTG